LISAGVFSDPPINISDVKKSGDTFSLLKDSVKWNAKNVNLKDGKYKVGIRPHNITTYKEGNNSVEIKGKVLISELSGSESLIHFKNANLNWVSLSNGIHQMNVGQEAKLYMNVDEFMYFDQNNNLVKHV
jgi:glycerol transport system ATP-binding protein